MKKILLVVMTAAVAFVLSGAGAWAQESASDEFTLEEIVVTAEKREVAIQEVPSSVAVIQGEDLAQEGKVSTSQILESVPNITYRSGSGTNPDGNITIRGVQRTQESGGTNAILPAVTATYTDGVYQGIGGNYDINRVEVLRGPQGTLYGRSATGGVVSFYTNDPKLEEFGGNVSAEFGTANLQNYQVAVNAPIGSKFALRAAGHYMSRDGYFEADGGYRETKEGRIKALFQPTDAFRIILSGSIAETQENGGGWQAYLEDPDTIDYKSTETEFSEGAPNKYRQVAINADYDFGKSTLTYVGGYHTYDNTGLGAEDGQGEALHRDLTEWPTDWYHSEELRLASNTNNDSPLSWLVGANYFKHRFDTTIFSVQTSWPADDELPAGDASGYMAPIFGQEADGYIENYGLFTEETLDISEDFRVTAGLRYDKTKMDQIEYYYSNDNLTTDGQSLFPAEYSSLVLDDKSDFDNITYKLRFEYDLTPDSMVYALTATGFMPGYTTISPVNSGPPDFTTSFQVLEHEQQQLTSYEIGSKNQLMDNRLRLNGNFYYYDYEGYPEAVNVRAGNGPPVFTVVAVPLHMWGVELQSEFLITTNDKIALSAGYGVAEIQGYDPETVTWSDGTVTPAEYTAMLKQLPGNPKTKASLAYDHTFTLGNGSSLVPRADVLYTGGYYLSQMTIAQFTAEGETITGGITGAGYQKEYNYQDAYVLVNVGVTWTSPASMYSVSGYVRNALDEEYKTDVGLTTTGLTRTSDGGPAISVTPGDPRTLGIMVNVKF